MRAKALLHQSLDACLASVHAARVKCVFDVVAALLHGGVLTAVGRGRSVGGRVSQKHTIKQVDRLLGNWCLHAEVHVFCAAISGVLLERVRHPLICIDLELYHQPTTPAPVS